MKISIITVGKSHDDTVRAAIAEYENRLSKHIGHITWMYIPNSDIKTESAAVIKRLSGTVVLLDETGALITSPDFANQLETYQNSSVKQLTFVIGGAFGVTPELKQYANFVWSLSPLVFPHQIARLLVIEQLYRAYDILAGGKYHHS